MKTIISKKTKNDIATYSYIELELMACSAVSGFPTTFSVTEIEEEIIRRQNEEWENGRS